MFDKEYGILDGENTGESFSRQAHNGQRVLYRTPGA